MNGRYKEIKISEIFDSQKYNIHSFLTDEENQKDLLESIRLIGVLAPPILLEESTNKFDIICGRQRLKCVSTVFKNKDILCRVLPQCTTKEEILTIILEDQHNNNGLSVIEQSCFLEMCSEFLEEQHIIHSYISSLPHGRITKGTKFLKSLNCLPEGIKRGIHKGYISEKVVNALQFFNNKDQNILLDLLIHLQLPGNNQKKMIEEIFDILQREEISLNEFLAQNSIAEIKNHKKLSGAQKGTKILHLMYEKNHPLLCAAEESFSQEVKKLKLPGNCTLKATNAFEREEVILSMRFFNLQEFKQIWHLLLKHLPTSVAKGKKRN